MTTTKPAAAPSTYVTGLCASGLHDRCRGAYAGAECTCPHHDEPEPVTVHCFFHCGRTEQSTDPIGAHEAMEQHYFDTHRDQIRTAVGWAS